jgi:putative tryptophan/tyrosine transport system substrate-binding protein
MIALVAGLAGSTIALTQPARRPRRIGILMSIQDSEEAQKRIGALRDGLQLAGWTQGDNLLVDQRWAAGNELRIQVYAAELIALSPDVIIVNDSRAATAVKKISEDIPIVFIATTDPVGLGLVKSMERPGGNMTGFTTFADTIIHGSIEALAEIAPNVRRVFVLVSSDDAGMKQFQRAVETTAPRAGIEKIPVAVRRAAEIEAAVAKCAESPGCGLAIIPGGVTIAHRDLIVALANKFRLPTVYGFRSFVAAGGLMSYGVDLPDLYRRAAGHVDQIFRGARAGDLPVQVPFKFELLINSRAARTLGIAIPANLLARADQVIE